MPQLPRFKIPRLYRITVQQGNVITQDMVDQLKPGMTRSQVAFIMGEPILRNTFDPDRWDYIYTVYLPGYFEQETRLSLFFQEDVLSYFTGDYAPSDATPDAEEVADAEPEEAVG
jgi:outer membrane protein assembly factor BamE